LYNNVKHVVLLPVIKIQYYEYVIIAINMPNML